jgi:hypothetical protein
MTVNADDVRKLLACQDADAVLVAIEGRTEVVTPAELDSADCRGALQIATRQELVQRAGSTAPSDRELAELAEGLDTALRNMGG